jgi:F-type H+-transporting ATPase subunit epsilon
MGTLILEIVTPKGVLVSQNVDMVIAPGAEGEFGVLPGHIDFLSAIVPGKLRFDYGGKSDHMAVNSGFAEVSGGRLSILADSAEKANDIDIERARRAMERAKKRLEKDRSSKAIDFQRAEAALKRAISRIEVAEKVQ